MSRIARAPSLQDELDLMSHEEEEKQRDERMTTDELQLELRDLDGRHHLSELERQRREDQMLRESAWDYFFADASVDAD